MAEPTPDVEVAWQRQADALPVAERLRVLRELAAEAGETVLPGAPITQDIVRLRKLLAIRAAEKKS